MKPYDVEAAKEEITEAAHLSLDHNIGRIMAAKDEAISKLEVQARTFAALPKDLGTLYRDASNAIFVEIDPVMFLPDARSPRTNMQAQIELRLDGYGPRTPPITATIPAKKHRMIIFFVPIE